MSDPLYRKEILRLAADAHGAGRLHGPHRTGVMVNPACGDKVTMDAAFDTQGRITAIAHETKACVLAQASASILGRDAAGMDRAALTRLRADVAAMLKSAASPPEAPFDVYTTFDGIADHAPRHACVLLPIDALLTAFNASDVAKPDAKTG